MRRATASLPDWRARACELAENTRLREQLTERDQQLVAAVRLNEVLCTWGRRLEARIAELASQKPHRPRTVDPTDVVKRLDAMIADGLDLPKAKARLVKELKSEGKSIGKRRIEIILQAQDRPVRIRRRFRLQVEKPAN